ncbi:MAG: adenosylmethionine--8-amino-7-oxononanoate aminotransferase BioA [Verrucomicrobiales bacterium]|nr:adenosylmethionine--8-amino-7-oxononanoate aminotransferase BioA [Verrucomicrobiales bacterium]
MDNSADLDRKFVWHPFTQMRDWMREEPIVIASGKGATLTDTKGNTYLDGNSSIWTNLHGHANPLINKAVVSQLKQISHSSALGLANVPAAHFARDLVEATNCGFPGKNQFSKVFYSDDGSTAMEVALKLSYEHSRRSGQSKKPFFLSLKGGYHGDTVGAVSLGSIDLFHKTYKNLLFKTDTTEAPYCYRCPYNRAKPQRADARTYVKCGKECLGSLEKKVASQAKTKQPFTAFVYEPVIQGAAGMIAQPKGWLKSAAEITKSHGLQLIADEIMTGFCRTGPLLASHKEGVAPDFVSLAKGITGGYLPMAATLTTETVFNSFLGEYGEFKSFFHGHSYTGNQLGAAAGQASLDLLKSGKSESQRAALENQLRTSLTMLWESPFVGDIRQEGTVIGVELVRDWKTREAFSLTDKAGIRVCQKMAQLGVLTRPIGNVIVLMPPYCTTARQADKMVFALSHAIQSELGNRPL